MSQVFAPIYLTQSQTYSNKYIQNRTITITSPQGMFADYTFCLPPDAGAYGKYLRMSTNFGTEWDSVAIFSYTTAQRLALNNVTLGTVVFDTTVGSAFIYNGSSWIGLSAGFTDATFSIADDITPSKVLQFQCANIAALTTRTITMANRDIDLDVPIFSTVSLINGANSVTLAGAVGTAAFTIVLPGTAGLAYQGLRAGAVAGALEWADSFISTRFGIFDAVTPANILSFVTTGMTSPRAITMCDRSLNLSTPVFQSVGYLDVGSNAVTIQPQVGTAAYAIGLPLALPAAGTRGLLESTDSGLTNWSVTPTLTSVALLEVGGPSAVTLQSPALGGSYSITLPAALPTVGNAMLISDITGATSWSNTVTDIALTNTQTLVGAVPEGFCASLELNPTYTSVAAQTVTIHSYLKAMQPVAAGAAVITHAALFELNAAAGTHLATTSTATNLSTVVGKLTNAWVKININNAIHYIPCYATDS